MSMTLLDRAALAVNAEIKRQLAGQPIPGVPDQPGTWAATGNSIDLRLCALAVAKVLLSEAADNVLSLPGLVAFTENIQARLRGEDVSGESDYAKGLRVGMTMHGGREIIAAFNAMASARLAALAKEAGNV